VSEINFSNRRITSRFFIKINSKVSIVKENNIIKESNCEIVDISYDGIQLIFKDNDFLFSYLNCVEHESYTIKLEFEYEEEKFLFNSNINWVKINDIGEKNFFVLSGLAINDKLNLKDKKLDLLVSIYMENIYLGDIA